MIRLRVPVLRRRRRSALGVLAVPAATCGSRCRTTAPRATGTTKRAALRPGRRGLRRRASTAGCWSWSSRRRPGGGAARRGRRSPRPSQGTTDVLAVAPGGVSPDGRTALLGVIPSTGPDRRGDRDAGARRARAPVAADVAATRRRAHRASPRSASTSRRSSPTRCRSTCWSSSGCRFLLLMLVFRSILVPLKATLGLPADRRRHVRRHGGGLPVGLAAPGWSALDTAGPLVSFLPILLIGILFGLAMDYEVFLVSRMREDYVHGETARRRSSPAWATAPGWSTAAALIMIVGVRRLHAGRRPDHQVDRLRARLRRRWSTPSSSG